MQDDEIERAMVDLQCLNLEINEAMIRMKAGQYGLASITLGSAVETLRNVAIQAEHWREAE